MDRESHAALMTLADPVRYAIWDVLLAGGPMKPSQLRRAAPEAAGSLTAHLRRLSQAGFIEADGEAATAASQRWRAARPTFDWDSAEDDPEAAWAINVLERIVAARREARVRTWLAEKHEQWPGWARVEVNRDYFLHLTPEDLDALDTALESVMNDWKKVSDERASAGEGAAVRVHLSGFPFRLPGGR